MCWPESERALERGVIGFDAVKHLVLCRIERRPPRVLLAHHLKALRLRPSLREYDKLARQCTAEGTNFPRYLLRLTELEM
jgi:hypothetical protein